MFPEDSESIAAEDATSGVPVLAQLAGAIWCVLGAVCLVVLFATLFPVFVFVAQSNDGLMRVIQLAGTACCSLTLAGIGAGFVHYGYQTFVGAAHSTFENGISSLLFGLIFLGIGTIVALGFSLVYSGIAIVLAIGHLATGVLAIIARNDYKAWRQSQRAANDN